MTLCSLVCVQTFKKNMLQESLNSDETSILDIYKVTSARALPIAHYVYWSFPQDSPSNRLKSLYIVNIFLFYTT